MLWTLEIPRADWGDYLGLISDSLGLMATRLWVEDAEGRSTPLTGPLPLVGLALEHKGSARGTIEVTLAEAQGLGIAFTHRVEAPIRMWVSVTEDGILDGILIEDGHECRTLVRFDPGPLESPGHRHLAFLHRLRQRPTP